MLESQQLCLSSYICRGLGCRVGHQVLDYVIEKIDQDTAVVGAYSLWINSCNASYAIAHGMVPLLSHGAVVTLGADSAGMVAPSNDT